VIQLAISRHIITLNIILNKALLLIHLVVKPKWYLPDIATQLRVVGGSNEDYETKIISLGHRDYVNKVPLSINKSCYATIFCKAEKTSSCCCMSAPGW
jgi:hypothetical protein